MRLIHLSDLHLGPYFIPRVATALIDKCHELQSDLIVISGDFTQRATKRQFQEAATLLAKLPKEVVCIPGNHDIPLYRVFERFLSPYALYQRYIHADLNVSYESDQLCLLALNTTRPLSCITNGRISAQQLDLCRSTFKSASANALRCLVLHHHLIAMGTESSSQAIPGGKQIIETLQEMRVDLVLHGHMHFSHIVHTLDLYPGVARDDGIVIAQTGTATSRRGRGPEREKNSFHLINHSPEGLTIDQYMYFTEEEGFIQTKEVRF